MPLVRLNGKVGYEQRLKTLMRRLMDKENENALGMDEVSEVHLSKVVLDETYDEK